MDFYLYRVGMIGIVKMRMIHTHVVKQADGDYFCWNYIVNCLCASVYKVYTSFQVFEYILFN